MMRVLNHPISRTTWLCLSTRTFTLWLIFLEKVIALLGRALVGEDAPNVLDFSIVITVCQIGKLL